MTDAVLANPLYSKVETKIPKAVVFDIDDTILDPQQRFTDAIRAGLVDKDGKPIQKKMMSVGQAWKKRNDFLYSTKELAKDKPIAGAKKLIANLEKKDYVIIYVTARPTQYRDRTIAQLEEKNFPIHKSNTGGILVFTKGGNASSASYKSDTISQLGGSYKIEMVFDDDSEVLDALRSHGIPGLYSSIRDYTGFGAKENPKKPSAYVEHGPKGRHVISEETDIDRAIEEAQKALEEEEDEEQQGFPGDWQDEESNTVSSKKIRRNPLPKPLKKGKRKMNADKYVDYLMFQNKKMKEEFPDTGQRYAVALDLVQKYYGKAARERVAYKKNPRKNPSSKSIENAKEMYTSFNNKSPSKVKKVKVDVGDTWIQLGNKAWQIGYTSGKEDGNENQRYIHTFNEESKDGDFPTLYLTVPSTKGGKPLMIIEGGSWKVETDETGIGWIYD